MLSQLRQLLAARPFRPFTVCVSDGRRLFVPHWEFAHVGPGGSTVIVYLTGDAFDIVSPLHITRLELAATGAADAPASAAA